MITYEPLWRFLKEKGVSTYKMERDYGFSKAMINKLRNNKNVNVSTINDICKKFDCNVSDVMEYIKE